MLNIDEDLIGLDHEALYAMARWHDRQAEILRSRAFDLAARAEDGDKIDKRLQKLDTIPSVVMKFLRHGCSLEEAHQKTAAIIGTLLVTVEKRWHKFVTLREGYGLAQRNRLILDLAALSMTNAQIGERVGLHPNSVSRIISQQKSFSRNAKPGLRIPASPVKEKPLTFPLFAGRYSPSHSGRRAIYAPGPDAGQGPLRP